MAEQKAKQGRIDSYYSYKTVNDKGDVTVNIDAFVGDQSPEDASKALLGALKGISSPAEDQVQ